MEILNQGGQESGPNAGSLTLSVRVRVRKQLLDFLQSANLKYVKLGYHYLISNAVYLFSVLILLRAYSAEIGRLSQRDLWRLWEQPHFDMTATLTFSGATVFTLCLYQYDHFSIKVKAYPRRESMKVHFLGILVLTAALLKTTDAVRNNAPKGDNLTALASNNNYRFGQMVVFDDPLTLDNNLHSPPVGRAQGFYFYDLKNTYGAWFSFTVVLNSTDHKGTITLAGADPATVDVRDISVVGGTGDFFMTRGIATLTTDTIQGEAYFRLRLNITLYECH